MQNISKTDPEYTGHGVDEKVPVGSRVVASDGGKMPNSVSEQSVAADGACAPPLNRNVMATEIISQYHENIS